jgi:hypothetical protein
MFGLGGQMDFHPNLGTSIYGTRHARHQFFCSYDFDFFDRAYVQVCSSLGGLGVVGR